jgi:putative endonuclease
MNTTQKGKIGEDLAVAFLRLHLYKIPERNYRCHSGEIDIIAEKGGYIVFVEVKYRHDTSKGLPREAVTPYKRSRIRRAAEDYIVCKNIKNKDFRFDVIEIIDKGKFRKEIEHIKNAF